MDAEQKRKPPAAGMGRKPGQVNKTTKLLKDAILQAAEKAGGKDGLVAYLTTQAKKNPKAFLTLLGRVLPMQVTGDGGAPIEVKIVRFGENRDDDQPAE